MKTHSGEKWNKCDQCDYASCCEKSNKCNQYDNALCIYNPLEGTIKNIVSQSATATNIGNDNDNNDNNNNDSDRNQRTNNIPTN